MHEKRLTTRKLYAFALTFMFLGGMFVLSGPVAEAHTGSEPHLHVTDAAGVEKVDGFSIFGQDAALYFKLKSAVNNSGPSLDTATNLVVYSMRAARQCLSTVPLTTGPSNLDILDGPYKVDMLETGPSTGEFLGSVRLRNLSTPGSPHPALSFATPAIKTHPEFGRIFGDQFVEVTNGANVCAAIKVGTATATARAFWRTSEDGQVVVRTDVQAPPAAGDATFGSADDVQLTFGQAISGYGRRLAFRVYDRDLDTSGETAQEYASLIRVRSDSDPGGEFVRLVESDSTTLLSEGAGEFWYGTVGFEDHPFANNTKVYARHGDRVWAEFGDEAGVDGLRRDVHFPVKDTATGIDFWTFKSTSDATLQFASRPSLYLTGLDSNTFAFATPATIVLTDIDRSLDTSDADTVTVSVSSDFMPAARSFTLLERGGLSGVFVGDVSLSSAPGTCPADVVCVRHGDRLRVSYSDTDFAGTVRTRTDEIRVFKADDARIILGPSDTTNRLVGTTTLYNVQVLDDDSNDDPLSRETVTVQIKSTSEPASLSLNLLETSENSGSFVGTVGFSTTSTSGNRIKVTDLDQVIVHYNDPLGRNGLPFKASSQENLVWRQATNAIVRLDASQYYERLAVPEAQASRAQIAVYDDDVNNPYSKDQVTVELVVPGGGRGVSATAHETGLDTGVFLATVTLGEGAAANPPTRDFDPEAPAVMRAEYLDLTTPSGTSAVVFSDEATWFGSAVRDAFRFEQAITVPERVDAAYHPDPGTTTSTIVVALYDDAAANVRTQEVTVTSTRCSSGFEMTLTAPVNENRYAGTLTLDTGGSGGSACSSRVDLGRLGIAIGDTLRITGSSVTDAALVQAYIAPAPAGQDRAGQNPQTTLFGYNQPGHIWINAPAANEDRTGVDVLGVDVRSFDVESGEESPVAFVVNAVETGPNTGLFMTSFGAAPATDVANFRIAATSPPSVHINSPSRPPTGGTSNSIQYSIYDDVLEPRFLHAIVNLDGQSYRGGFQWFPATDGNVVVSDLTGPVSSTILLRDDRLQGHQVFTAKGNGGATYTFTGATFSPTYTGVYSVVTGEAVPSDGGAGSYTIGTVASQVGSNAADVVEQPFGDTNNDGALSCADIIPSRANIRCTSTLAQLMNGVYNHQDGCVADPPGNCDFTIRYLARIIPSSGVGVNEANMIGIGDDTDENDRFHFKVVAPNQIMFGGPVPQDADIFVQSRAPTVPVVAKSQNTGETENLVLNLVTSTSDAEFANYRGTLATEQTGTSANQVIHVRGGVTDHVDRISFVHNDARRADGLAGAGDVNSFRSIVKTITWFKTETSQISFMKADLSGAESGPFFGPYLPVKIIDIDMDKTSQPDKFMAEARNGNAGSASDSYQFLLRETGARTGEFWGVVAIDATSALSPSDEQINMDGLSQGSVIVTHDDPRSSTGLSSRPSSVISWRPAQSGIVAVFPSLPADTGGTELTSPITGTNGALFVRVTDPDANDNAVLRDTITVHVSSASSPAGMDVELLETGANTNVFRSSEIRFGPSSAGGRVIATDPKGTGDAIRVVYTDAINSAGVRQAFEPGPTILWDRTFDGQVSIDRDTFIGVDGPANPDNLGVSVGLIKFGVVMVRDNDLNTDSRLVEEHLVGGVGREIAIGRIDPSSGTELSDSVVALKLIETGANTGVFVSRFAFVPSDDDRVEGETYTPVGAVGAGASQPISQLIRATYTDAVDSLGETLTDFTAETRWQRAGVGAVVFDLASYNDLAQIPRITLYDGQLDTPAPATGTDPQTRNTVNVIVNSQASPTALTVLLTETGGHTGIFTNTFGLTDGSTGSGKIQVATIDTLEVSYTDASPSGVRTDTAVVRIGDKAPPVTTISTIPATPTGARGVFKEPVEVRFTVNEAVSKTMFKLNGSEAREWNGVGLQLGPGVHDLEAWSIDLAENSELTANSVEKRTIVVDLHPVTQTVIGVTAKAIAGGKILVSWTDVTSKTNPLEFFEYLVYRDGSTTPMNTTEASFTDTLTDEVEHTYRVALSDMAGNIGPLSSSVSATADKTLPVLTAPLITPTGFDIRKAPSGISVRVGATDAHLAGVKAELLQGAGTSIANTTLAVSTGSTFTGLIPVEDLDQPCTCTLTITAFDDAGNEATLSFNYIITGPDTQLPTVTIADPTVGLGTPLRVTVADNVALTKIQYRLDGGSPVSVPVSGRPSSLTFEVPSSVLTLGAHKILVEAEDNATSDSGALAPNKASIELAFTVIEGGTSTPPSTFFLPTTVSTRSDGSIVVSWEVPSTVSGVAGFQVWRSSSPFALVGNVTNPSERSFVDTSALAGTVYRYVVTFYTASPFSSLAQVPGYTSDDNVPASAPVQPEEGGLPGWLMTVFIVGAIIAVAAIIAIFIASRRGSSPSQQTVQTSQPAPAQVEPQPVRRMAAMETHRLRCPQCSHRFEVSGTKPIVTNCPNCGRKGILR